MVDCEECGAPTHYVFDRWLVGPMATGKIRALCDGCGYRLMRTRIENPTTQ